MADTTDVLLILKVVYTTYALAVISLFAWFGYSLTAKSAITSRIRIPFYVYMASLVVIGVFLHILTFNAIPWVEQDIKRAQIQPDQTIKILVKDHKFILPEGKLTIACNQKVRFEVDSADLTYGFGLFRPDNTMVFQMQVLPGSRNDLLWQFRKNGSFTIRSTEYSGPAGAHMVLSDAVTVSGCNDDKVARN